jgi:hypothetical protein
MSPILPRKSEKIIHIERHRQSSETQFDMELSIESNIHTNDNNINEDMNVENESFEEINKEKYEFIVSNPINININIKENKKNNIEQSHSGTPIQDSLKYYIHNSINIIKESANYISGNFKSI